MENVNELKGVHGTTVSRLQLIQKNGFRKSEGRLGEGVYFWAESPYAKHLAKAWWEFQLSKKTYSGDKYQGCSVITAIIETLEEELLDLDDKEIKDRLASLCMKQGIKYYDKNYKIATLVMCFIADLEKTLECQFKALVCTVAPPPGEFAADYPYKALGQPACYIVIDTECIKSTTSAIC